MTVLGLPHSSAEFRRPWQGMEAFGCVADQLCGFLMRRSAGGRVVGMAGHSGWLVRS
jgi:hypothetical protein